MEGEIKVTSAFLFDLKASIQHTTRPPNVLHKIHRIKAEERIKMKKYENASIQCIFSGLFVYLMVFGAVVAVVGKIQKL